MTGELNVAGLARAFFAARNSPNNQNATSTNHK